MTITRRPARTAKPAVRAATKTPESFIESAQHPITAEAEAAETAEDEKSAKKIKGKKIKDRDKEREKTKDHKKSKDKEAVLIRFEDEQLGLMDGRAAALGLSRAAWVRMVVAKALMDKNN